MQNTTLYYFTFIGFVIFPIFCLVLILRGLKLTLRKSDFSSKKQNKIFFLTSLLFLFWLLLTSSLSSIGLFEINEQKPIMPPLLLLFVNIPVLIVVAFVNFSKTLKQIIKLIPAQWLVYFQSFRIIVEGLIWLVFIQNLLPIQMTFEGKNFDILVGLMALPMGYLVWKQNSILTKKKILIVWNILGMCFLAAVILISVLSSPLPIRYFMNEPTVKIVASFPFVWLPTVLVVIAYSVHILSFKQALLMKKQH